MEDAGRDPQDKPRRKDIWRHVDWRPSSYRGNDVVALYGLMVFIRALFSISKTEKSERMVKDLNDRDGAPPLW